MLQGVLIDIRGCVFESYLDKRHRMQHNGPSQFTTTCYPNKQLVAERKRFRQFSYFDHRNVL